jgi:hypothetical protein
VPHHVPIGHASGTGTAAAFTVTNTPAGLHKGYMAGIDGVGGGEAAIRLTPSGTAGALYYYRNGWRQLA